MVWSIAITYIAIETKTVLKAQGAINITTFAVMFLLASAQLSVSRFLAGSDKPALAETAFKSSILMLIAALFDLFDGCIDEFITRFQQTLGLLELAYPLHIVSWLITVISVAFAVLSLDSFLRCLAKLTFEKHANKNVRRKSKIWPVGSREPSRRKLRS